MPGKGLGYFGYARQRDKLFIDHEKPSGDEEPWEQMRGIPAPSEKQGPKAWQVAQMSNRTGKDIRGKAKGRLEEGKAVGKRKGYDPPGQAKEKVPPGQAKEKPGKGKKSQGRGPPSHSEGRGPVRAVDPDRGEGFDQFIEGRAPFVRDVFVKEGPDGPVEVRVQQSASPLGRFELVVDHPDGGTEWIGSYNDQERAYNRMHEWMRSNSNPAQRRLR